MAELLLAKALAYLALLVRLTIFFNLLPPIRAYVPMNSRAVICVALALPALKRTIEDDYLMTFLVEALYGACLALPVAIVSYLPSYYGRLVDTFRGAQFGELISPESGDRITPLEQLGDLMVLLVLFLPIFHLPLFLHLVSPITVANSSGELWVKSLILLFGDVLTCGLLLAAPVALSCFTFDCVTGLLSRLVKRVNLIFEVMPIKLLLGLLSLLISFAIVGEDLISEKIINCLNVSLGISAQIYRTFVRL